MNAMNTTSTVLQTPQPDKTEILSTLAALHCPQDVIELRVFPKGRKAIHSGYFDSDHLNLLADYAVQYSAQGASVYITLNPVDPQLLNRYANRIETNPQATTNDKQVTHRRWLLIDLDPVRPSGTGATEPQVQAAMAKAIEIQQYLQSLDWPSPVMAMSGNGFHLLYAVNLPNDEDTKTLLKASLESLGNRFDDDQIKVDRTVFNAARICKLYGTVANKGDHTAQAPWRPSLMMDTPTRHEVRREQLRALTAPTLPYEGVNAFTNKIGNAQASGFNLEAFFDQHGIQYTTDQHEGRERFKLAACPFNPEHVNGEAAVFRGPTGQLGFNCQHDSCFSYHWKDVRNLLDGREATATTMIPVHATAAAQPSANNLESSQGHPRLHSALMAIPANATLDKHSAEQVIGMALRHVSSGVDQVTGHSLCIEWDALTGGNSCTVFNKSDPQYASRKPIGLPSLYKMARLQGWRETLPWPEPTPLPGALPPVQALTEDLLPTALRAWVMDIAHRMQCPPDFVAVSALVGLSSLVGARAVVQPKALDTWQVVPNLWGLVVGRPGVKKSPALGEALKPITHMQERELDAIQAAMNAWLLDCQLVDMQKGANAKEAKILAATDPVAARALLAPLNMPAEPVARRFTVNDATVEKLGELMQQNPWGILSYRDELYGLLTSMDKPGQEGSRAFMLQSYDGNQGYTFDRIGRGTVNISRVCLSLMGGIQPGRVQEYVRGAVSGGSSDDGLLQRFGLAVWPDITGAVIHVDQLPDAAAKEAAWAVYERLAKLQPVSETEPQVWRFDEAAQAVFVEWLVAFEEEIRGDELHPALVSHLSKYRKLIPALALLFALIDKPETNGVIHEAEIKRALSMGKYLRSHAERLYAAAVLPETADAANLLGKIKAGKLTGSDGVLLDTFTPRQVALKGWSGLNKPINVRKAAELLSDFDVLRIEPLESSASGGRPSERYSINPAVLAEISIT
jgi:putative DNA primase/helicase